MKVVRPEGWYMMYWLGYLVFGSVFAAVTFWVVWRLLDRWFPK